MSEDLYRLIKSLNRHEKRYFSMTASLYDREKIYMKLFELIDSQKEYDEKKLKEQLGVNQLPVVKNRLFQLILRSLGSLYSEKSHDALIRDQLIQAQVLGSKGLFEASLRILDRCRNRAMTSGRYELALEAIRLYPAKGLLELEINSLWALEEELIGKIARVSFLRRVTNIFERRYNCEGVFRSMEQQAEYAEWFHHPYFKEEQSGTEELYFSHLAKTWFCILSSDFENAHTQLIIILHQMDSEKLYEEDLIWKERKGSALIMYLRVCIELGRSLEQELAEKEIPWFSFGYKEQCELISLNLLSENRAGYVSNENETVIDAIDFLNHDSPEKDSAYAVMALKLELGRFYFLNGDYKRAIRYSYGLLHDKTGAGYQLTFQAYQLNILSHYAAGNMELIDSLCRACSRKLSGNGKIYPFEGLFLTMMRKLIDKSGRVKNELLAEFSKQFLELRKDKFEESMLRDFDLLSWIESELSGVKITQLISAKNETEVNFIQSR